VSRGTAAVWALAVALARSSGAMAQNADDNPVVSADDAFGLTLGLESTGIYGPWGVRGFNPQAAGNARIDGLYFDQQGSLSERVVAGSAIRVGISATDYAFPAPTGIVDYQLRAATDGKATAEVIAEAGPYGNRSISVDSSLPLAGKELQLPFGVDYQLEGPIPGSGSNLGYGATIANFGAVPQWTPNDRVTVRAIFDWQDTRDARTLPLVFSGGDYLPPRIGRGFLGQYWALNHYLAENLGSLVTAELGSHWALAAGLFRSLSDTPVSYADLYLDAQPNGLADHQLVGSPDQSIAATSGETRLTGRFSSAEWSQTAVLMLRGRDELAHYGGADAIDAGPAYIGAGTPVPEPRFVYSPRTSDRTRLWSAGAAYQIRRARLGELSLGAQKESYDKTVSPPGQPRSSLSDSTWRFYGNGSLRLIGAAVAYAGYTQGFEDSGAAPNDVANRNAILPTTRTWQADGGLRYPVTSKLALIAGVFEIRKPYFNLDSDDFYRELGWQQAKGVELSIAGRLAPGLAVNAGGLFGRVDVTGAALAAQGIGAAAVGQPHDQFTINCNYDLPRWPAWSLDFGVYHFGAVPGTVNDAVYVPSLTELSLGARYRFELLGARAILRTQVQNATNSYIWNIASSPGFYQLAPRTFLAYLTVDL
jgi:iron complex outermembrane recepter protein